MSAVDETALAYGVAMQRRFDSQQAQLHESGAILVFMTHARADGWSWARIGRSLSVSGNAARRYYNRNHQPAA